MRSIVAVDVALIVLCIVVLVWCARKFNQYQHRRARLRQKRIVWERLTALEQRQKAWTVTDGDGIRPVRQRFEGKRNA